MDWQSDRHPTLEDRSYIAALRCGRADCTDGPFRPVERCRCAIAAGLHPVPETVNCRPETLLLILIAAVGTEKLAVIVFGPFITTGNGFVEPLASPDQVLN